MAKAKKTATVVKRRKRAADKSDQLPQPEMPQVNEPQASYGKGDPGKRSTVKKIAAKKRAGMFPGMADWYVDSLRDEARETMDKADRLAKVMLRDKKKSKPKKGDPSIPGMIDVDRFSGALSHLKGDAVKIQRRMRDEG